MSATKNLLSQDTDSLQLLPTVEAGVGLCREGDWDNGLELLWKASRKAADSDELPASFYAYAGFGTARYQHQLAEGERMCRYAVRLDSSDPAHYLMLAEVCLLRRNRKEAVDALLKGLRLEPHHAPLRRLQKRIGFRRPPVLSFWSRDHPLNRFLGRLRHRRKSR